MITGRRRTVAQHGLALRSSRLRRSAWSARGRARRSCAGPRPCRRPGSDSSTTSTLMLADEVVVARRRARRRATAVRPPRSSVTAARAARACAAQAIASLVCVVGHRALVGPSASAGDGCRHLGRGGDRSSAWVTARPITSRSAPASTASCGRGRRGPGRAGRRRRGGCRARPRRSAGASCRAVVQVVGGADEAAAAGLDGDARPGCGRMWGGARVVAGEHGDRQRDRARAGRPRSAPSRRPSTPARSMSTPPMACRVR